MFTKHILSFIIVRIMPGQEGTKALRIALVQMNPVVGDLAGNSARMLEHIRAAARKKADIVAFPELALTGYPPEDLVLKPQFITDNLNQIRRLAGRVDGITVIAGFVDRGPDGALYNAAAVIAGKKIVDIYHKIFLPNYGVFDEFRYFKPGGTYPVYSLSGTRFGVNICEDIWHRKGPTHIQAMAGAEFIININASPYEQGKPEIRECILKERSSKSGVTVAYLNTVGGQDELVFDGMSMVFDRNGEMVARAPQFAEDVLIVDLDIRQLKRGKKSGSLPAGYAGKVRRVRLPGKKERPLSSPFAMPLAPCLGSEEEVYRALVLGTRDYVLKNGFRGVVIGLSGGIDSSLVATIASDALGREQVRGLFMPSVITSGESREDAFALAERLGISITEIPIAGIMQCYTAALEPSFRGTSPDTTEENLQARIRGNLLMAFSNKFGWLVLTTGNKSEMGVGYATLYGDMAGGFAVIKDVPKVMVYELCRWRNTLGKGPVIPDRVLTKEPTAELRPNQRDTDSLPPYPVLDPILRAYIEDELTFEEILAMGCDPGQARRVIAMVDRSEYKRRQAPPGVKITRRAFGRDRRFPITNRYRSY